MNKQEFLELIKEPEEIPFWAKWFGLKMLCVGVMIGIVLSIMFG